MLNWLGCDRVQFAWNPLGSLSETKGIKGIRMNIIMFFAYSTHLTILPSLFYVNVLQASTRFWRRSFSSFFLGPPFSKLFQVRVFVCLCVCLVPADECHKRAIHAAFCVFRTCRNAGGVTSRSKPKNAILASMLILQGLDIVEIASRTALRDS